ncbi:MAG: hypothetical protein ACE5IP_01285 [Terriglobia bacterium]
MRIPINLASRPFVNYRPFVVTAGLLALVAAGFTLFVGVEGVRTWQKRTTTQARVRELETQHQELVSQQGQLEAELQDPATVELLEHVRFLNRVIRQKGFSWTALFFDLQQRLPRQVRVLSLSPSLRDDGLVEVDIRLGSQSPQAVVRFLRSLEESDEFRQTVLHSQSRPTRAAGGDRLNADVSALYARE